MPYNGDLIAETTAQDGTRFRVVLVPDQDAENPRDDFAPAGVMHMLDQPRHYVPRESDIPDLDTKIIDHDFTIVASWLRIFHASVVLPLYWTGYDVPSAGTADEAPQAGDYAGVTFDTPETRRRGGWPNDPASVAMPEALAADVATYAQWAEGEVYGYIVERGEDGDQVDSCWGHIGSEWAEEAAREALESAVAAYGDEKAQEAAEAAQDEAEVADLMAAETGGWRY
jgi:hypothetical protein